ncbi:hypothetical protein RIR_jg37731.t1 [Rhizophagus irregularis DAOM 181602=DAOM 197198]|uniref:Uncharacterized protein n=1 Tax=Rhizophagus irregularis (strain DAOM 197198w) TaxID=1432141 RepID=A0A015LXL1_RHIIW|nr:hypothetical protein RirG_189250 [Rhizophagus irregularis DAOM 197198w]GBC47008.1 hypothetical protein RIR_jg37731.t1 [Rhizophagus irregularis DAOM 181602=DAOM 197198]
MSDASNTTYMDEIIKKSFQTKAATENDRLYTTAVVCYILNVNSGGIKIEKKSILKLLMDQLQVSYFNILIYFHCILNYD